MSESNNSLPIITKTRIIEDLRQLGISSGQTVMLHASVKAIGWVVGGPDTVLQALLDLLTSKGTLMMLAGWEDNPYHIKEWPQEKQAAYLEECPSFNPATSRANRKWSILNEYLRTRPGANRSNHPEGSIVAVGNNARWITENQPLQYGYGPGSPLAKLCEANGKVLLLGAPFDSVTLVHYAECLAKVKNKRIARYKMPILQDGKSIWVDIEEYDTSLGIVDWHGTDYLPVIVREYLSTGQASHGKVGAAESYLFDGQDFVKFAVRWMEKQFANLA